MSKAKKPADLKIPQRKPADRKKKLGKGLGALLGETKIAEAVAPSGGSAVDNAEAPKTASAADSPIAASGLSSLPIAAIEPLPGQPRTQFDDAALDELAQSIAARGVIQPIIVTQIAKGRYRLVAGERRWRAAQRARLHAIPALVRELDEREIMALALIENLQREDLNPVEEARAFHRLADGEDMTQAEIASLVGKSRSHVANLMRLTSLPDAVLEFVEAGTLSMGHARALIGHEKASELAKQAASDGMSVRALEKLVQSNGLSGLGKTKSKPALNASGQDDADILAVQRHLEEFLGLPVRIKPNADQKSGGLTVQYRTLDQLDMVCQRLTGGDI